MAKAGAAQFTIDGVEEILAELKTLEARVAKKLIQSALRKAMKPIKKAIDQNIPVGETGAMKEAGSKIRSLKRSRKRFGVTVGIGKKDWTGPTWYAANVELGTSKMPGRGFMRRAFDEKKEEAAKIIKDEIGKGILKEANRN